MIVRSYLGPNGYHMPKVPGVGEIISGMVSLECKERSEKDLHLKGGTCENYL